MGESILNLRSGRVRTGICELPVMASLTEMIQSGNLEARNAALNCLSRLATGNQPTILCQFYDTELIPEESARDSIQRSVIPALRGLLGSTNPSTRFWAAASFAKLCKTRESTGMAHPHIQTRPY